MIRPLSRLLLAALALAALPTGQPAGAAESTALLDAQCVQATVNVNVHPNVNGYVARNDLAVVPSPTALGWTASCWLQTVEAPGVGEVPGSRVDCAGGNLPALCQGQPAALQPGTYYSCLQYEVTDPEGTYRYTSGRCTAGYYDGNGVWHTRSRGGTVSPGINSPVVDSDCGVVTGAGNTSYLTLTPRPTVVNWFASCWLQTTETPGTSEVPGSRINCAGGSGPSLCQSEPAALAPGTYYSCLSYEVTDPQGTYRYTSGRCTAGYYDGNGVWHTRSRGGSVGSVTSLLPAIVQT